MIIYKTVQKVISQDSLQKMQFLEYKTTLSQNWPKQVFEVHLNCLTNSTN